MLTYQCPNCHKKYEVTVMGNRFSYLCQTSNNHNKVLTLGHEDDECFLCQEEVRQVETEARAKLRATHPLEETI